MVFKSFARLFGALWGHRRPIRKTGSQHGFRRKMAIDFLEDRLVPALPAPVVENTYMMYNPGSVTASNDEVSPHAAYDPLDPNRIVLVTGFGSNTGPVGNTVGVDYSIDGGRTWAFITIAPSTTDPATNGSYEFVVNPTVAWDRDHNFYIVHAETNAAQQSGSIVFNSFDFSDTTRAPQPTVQGKVLDQWYRGPNAAQANVLDSSYTPFIGIDNNLPEYVDPDTGFVQRDSLANMRPDPNFGRTGENIPKAIFVGWTSREVNPTNPNSLAVRMVASGNGGATFSTYEKVTDDDPIWTVVPPPANVQPFQGARPQFFFTQGSSFDPNGTAAPAVEGGLVGVVFDNATGTPNDGAGSIRMDVFRPDEGVADQAAVVVGEFNGLTGRINDAHEHPPQPAIAPLPHITGVTNFPIDVDITDPEFDYLVNLEVTLAITHPHLNQLRLDLVAPDGTSVRLLNNRTNAFGLDRVPGPNSTIYLGVADEANLGIINGVPMGTTFTNTAWRTMPNLDVRDLSIISPNAAVAPYIGKFLPEETQSVIGGQAGQGLNQYYGRTAAQLKGTWFLRVSDFRYDGNNPGADQLVDRLELKFSSKLNKNVAGAGAGPGRFGTDSVVGTGARAVGPTTPYAPAGGALGVTGVGPSVTVAVDNTLGSFSPNQGLVYVAYASANGNILLRTVTGVNTFANIGVNPVLGRVALNDDSAADNFSEGNRLQHSPSLAVDPTTGTLVAMWADARNDPANFRFAHYVTSSIDGGQTFSPQVAADVPKTAKNALTGQTINLEPIPGNASSAGVYSFGERGGTVLAFGGKAIPFFASNWNQNFSGVFTGDIHIGAGPRIIGGDQGPIVVDSTAGIGLAYNNQFTPDGRRMLDGFVVTFDRPIDPSTFGPNDIQLKYQSPYLPANNFVDLSSQVQSLTPLGQGSSTGVVDTRPTISLNDVVVRETPDTVGGTLVAEFTVYLSMVQTTPTSVEWRTADGTALAGREYAGSSGKVTIPAGQSFTKFSVPIFPNTLKGGDRYFWAGLSNAPTGILINKAIGRATILDDDSSPKLAIGDGVAREGANGTSFIRFPIYLSAPAAGSVTLNYQTSDGTALSGPAGDYIATANSVTIPANTTAWAIDIPILGDAQPEAHENFFLNIQGPSSRNEQQTIILGNSGNLNANVTLAFMGQAATSALPIGTLPTAAALQTHLNSITALTGNVTVTSPVAGTYVVTFRATFAGLDVPMISAFSTLTGGVFDITESVKGGSGGSNVHILRSSAAGVIFNDDDLAVSVGDVTVQENTNTNATVTFYVNGATSTPINIVYTVGGGTATLGLDYQNPAVFNVTIAPNTTSVSVNIPIVANTLAEGTETFNVTITSVTNAGVARGVGEVTIADDDADATRLYVTDAAVRDGDRGDTNVMNVELRLAAPVSFDVVGTYSTTGGTAAAGVDYTPVAAQPFTITAGTLFTTVTVDVLGDLRVEGNETINVTATIADPRVTLARATGIGTIVDDDVQLYASDAIVREGGVMRFRVFVDSPKDKDIAFTFDTIENTALHHVSPTDLKNYSQVFNGAGLIPAGATFTDVSVFTRDADATTAANGASLDFNIQINPASITVGGQAATGAEAGTIIRRGLAIGTIVGTGGGSLLTVSNPTIREGATGNSFMQFTVFLSQPQTTTVTFHYITSLDTRAPAALRALATVDPLPGDDYIYTEALKYIPSIPASTPLDIIRMPSGSTQFTFNVPINGDVTVEPDESFLVFFTDPVGASFTRNTLFPTPGDIYGVSIHRGTILNDDRLQAFVPNAWVNENATPGVSQVVMSNPAGFPADLVVDHRPGTATDPTDYVGGISTFTVPGAATASAISTTITNDFRADGDRTFSYDFVAGTEVAAGNLNPTVTIIDDDVPNVVIGETTVQEVDGGTTTAVVPVFVTGDLNAPITVDYAFLDETAIAGLDYNSTPGSVTFTPGGPKVQFINVPILSDAVAAGNKVFRVIATNITGGGGLFLQNEQQRIDVTGSVYSIKFRFDGVESDMAVNTFGGNVTAAQIQAALQTIPRLAGNVLVTQPVAGQFVVDFVNGFAGVDVTPIEIVTFEATTTPATVTVTTTNVGSIRPTMVTIVDGSMKPTLYLDAPLQVEGNSGAPTVSYRLLSSYPIGTNIVVPVTTTNGTATSGDYVGLSSFNVTLNANTTETTFNVTITPDTAPEANETFSASLGATTNAFATTPTGTGIGTILDDDDAPNLAVDDVVVQEGNLGLHNVTVTFRLNKASTSPITFTYQTIDGTALGNLDFIPATAPLTIPAGATTATVQFAIRCDSMKEGDEYFDVRVRDLVGATVIKDLGRILIQDDDGEFGATSFLVRVTPQSQVGTYSYTVGPAIANRIRVVGRDESQAIYVTQVAGNYTLSYNGFTTAPIPAFATANQVRDALNLLPSIAGANAFVDVYGTGTGAVNGTVDDPFVVTFRGGLASTDVPAITSTGAIVLARREGGVASNLEDGTFGVYTPPAFYQNIPIGGVSPSFSQITISGLDPSQIVRDLSVTVDLNHPDPANFLRIDLIAPDERVVRLFDSLEFPIGVTGGNLLNTTFDYEAGTRVSEANPPFAGSYRPYNADYAAGTTTTDLNNNLTDVVQLNQLYGISANGVWTLRVTDASGLPNAGLLKNWSLNLDTGAVRKEQRGAAMDQNHDGIDNDKVRDFDGFAAPDPIGGRPFQLPYVTSTFPLIIPGPNAEEFPYEFRSQESLPIPAEQYGGTGTAIDTIVSKITASGIPAGLAIRDVNVAVSLTHGSTSDLVLTLIAPDGTRVPLSTNRFLATTTVFNDQTNASSPTNYVVPASPLRSLNGKNPNGEWKLEIVDNAFPSNGTLLQWDLSIGTERLALNTDISSYDVKFDRDINVATFKPQNILRFTGPTGAIVGTATVPITVTPIAPYATNVTLGGVTAAGQAARTFRIGFPTQNISGSYSFVFGPDPTNNDLNTNYIADILGNKVDRNFNAGLNVLRGGDPTDAQIVNKSYSSGPLAAQPTINVVGSKTTNFEINVTDAFQVRGVTLVLNLLHTKVDDIEARLISPSGTVLPLFTKVGGFASVPQNFQNLTLDDAASTPIQLGNPPYNGSFNPEQPLSRFAGEASNGKWTLAITNTGGTGGTLTGWDLRLKQSQPGTGLGETGIDQFQQHFRVFIQDPTNALTKKTWTNIGPASENLAGEGGSPIVPTVAVDASDPSGNTVYVGTSNGGVWKTSNFLTTDELGPTWIPLLDFSPISSQSGHGLTVGSIGIFARNRDPNQSVVFVGTGGQGGIGVGLLRSLDGGKTWQVLDSLVNGDVQTGAISPIADPTRGRQFSNTRIENIEVDPNLGNAGQIIAYITVEGGPAPGVYRTNNAGVSWTLIRAGTATDIALAPGSRGVNGNLEVLYAAFANQGVFLTPNATSAVNMTRLDGGDGVGYRIHPNPVTGITEVVPVTNPPTTPITNAGADIRLATPVLTGNPLLDTVYQGFVYAVSNGRLYVSKDFGANWTLVKIPGRITPAGVIGTNDEDLTQASITQPVLTTLAIDPKNANIVYADSDLGFLRIDLTKLSDPYAIVQLDNSEKDGGLTANATTGAVTAVTANFGGGFIGPGSPYGIFNPDDPLNPKRPYLNAMRDPDEPFLQPSGQFIQNVTRFVNDGGDVSWTYHLTNPATGGTYYAPINRMNEIVPVVDPQSGLVRLVLAGQQGLYTAINDDDGQIYLDGNQTLRPLADMRTGNIQASVMWAGASQPSILAADIAKSLFFGMEVNGSFHSTNSFLSTGNLAWIRDNGVGQDVQVDPSGAGKFYQYINQSQTDVQNGNLLPVDIFQITNPGTLPISRINGLTEAGDNIALGTGQWPTGLANYPYINTPAVGRFAINPVDPTAIVIGSRAPTGGVFRTSGPLTGQGVQWFKIGQSADFNNANITALAFGSPNPLTPTVLSDFIYAGTAGGRIYVTTVGGGPAGWRNISNGLAGTVVRSIVPNPKAGSKEVYAVTDVGVFWLPDSSVATPTWQRLNDVAGKDAIFAKTRAIFGTNEVVPAATFLTDVVADWRFAIPNASGGGTHPVLFVSTDGGVFRSTDQGVTWTLYPSIAGQAAPVEGGYLPNVLVTDLELVLGETTPNSGFLNESTGFNLLYATTYGRSAYAIRLDNSDVETSRQTPPFGPRVTALTPIIPGDGTQLTAIDVTFSTTVDPTTFQPSDIVSFAGPGGAIGVASITQISSTVYRLAFTPQTVGGTYTLSFGPGVSDFSGNLMDQNGNKVNGEPATQTSPGDRFTGSLVFVPNTPPTISNILDTNILPGAAASITVPFTIGDAQTPNSLVVAATSSNALFVAPAGLVLGGSGANRTLTITPAANSFGLTTITVVVTDPLGLSATDTFQFTVDTPPTLAPIGDQVLVHSKPSSPTIVTLTLNGADADGHTLTYPTPTTTGIASTAYTFEQSLGLVIHSGGLFPNLHGRQEKWLFNSARSDWYLILPTGAMHLYSGIEANPIGAFIAQYSPRHYLHPELLTGLTQLGNSFHQNLHGFNEKWFFSPTTGWYAILPSGALHAYGSPSSPIGALVRTFTPDYWTYPELISQPAGPNNPPAGTVSVAGNVLTIQPPANWIGSFQVSALVSDGFLTASRTFTVTVHDQSPTASFIPEKLVNHGAAASTYPTNVADPDADVLTYQILNVAPAPNQARIFQQQFGLVSQADFYFNLHGQNEKWFYGTVTNKWYLITTTGLFKEWNGSTSNPSSSPDLWNFGPAYYANPSLITNPAPLATTPIPAGLVAIVGGQIALNPSVAPTFTGSFKVTFSASDNMAPPVYQEFIVTVTNNAPTFSVPAEQTLNHLGGSRTFNLNPADLDGDALTYSVSTTLATSTTFEIDRQYNFTQTNPNYHFNLHGDQEKWMLGIVKNQWYAIVRHPSDSTLAQIFEWDNVSYASTKAKGPIATVARIYYDDPSLLHDPIMPAIPPVGTVTISPAGVLTITPPTNFAGTFDVNVTVSDGGLSVTKTFKVTIYDKAPTLQPLANVTMSRNGTQQINLTISGATPSASDPDGEAVTLSVLDTTTASTLYNLDLSRNMTKLANSYFENKYGVNEKWLFSPSDGQWYAILPTGRLHLFSGNTSAPLGALIASLPQSVYSDPSLLHEAATPISPLTAPTPPAPVSVGQSMVFDSGANVWRLTISPNGFVGTFQVSVLVSDGIIVRWRKFLVTTT